MSEAFRSHVLWVVLLGGCGDGAEEARRELGAVVEALDLSPIERPDRDSEARIELGAALFFDPILSGNRDQSCATCHSPLHGTTDGRSLAVGTGALKEDGLRLPGPDHTFTPRSAPALFNLGHAEMDVMFWDGRLERTEDGRFVLYDVANGSTEVERKVLPEGAERLLSAQVMLPVLDRQEMRGQHGEVDIFGQSNELAIFTDRDLEPIWDALMIRLGEIEQYRTLFEAAFPDKSWEEMDFVDASNAMSDFIVDRFTLVDSPWDRFLAGDSEALSGDEAKGALLFFGEARCSTCHGGDLLSDMTVYNVAVPPMTTGPSDYSDVDLGAAHRSQAGSEAHFAFRVPPLRNVALTGPWMHDGCYSTLEAVIHHKSDVLEGLWSYDATQLSPEFRDQVHHSDEVLTQVEEALSHEVQTPLGLNTDETAQLVNFLEALTSPYALDLSAEQPESVPSGLPMVEP